MREKLIELLHNFHLDYNGYICDGCGTQVAERVCASIADHLIANGVTVQEWIPVTKRLPERFVYVLVMTDFGEAAVARLKGNGRWYIGWANDKYDGVTHWMPLPEPPKGE